ncbi:MAG: hypothetical protein RJR34_05800 [Candidatus Methanoculleus thermohydrogenotrophicum]|nr:hypothetical protein [Candidatus Methanoculleus thermohydrogenotrophicum]
MRIIRAPTLARAHELAVRTVLEKGWVLETEDDEATIECDELALVVAAPETESDGEPRLPLQAAVPGRLRRKPPRGL